MPRRRGSLCLLRIEGDGNCFYAALIQALGGMRVLATRLSPDLDRAMRRAFASQPVLRPHRLLAQSASLYDSHASCIQWIRCVAAAAIVCTDRLSFWPGTPESCVKECVAMGRFADHLFIQAIVDAFGIRLSIVNTSGTVICLGRRGSRWQARLRYTGHHYDAIVPCRSCIRP